MTKVMKEDRNGRKKTRILEQKENEEEDGVDERKKQTMMIKLS